MKSSTRKRSVRTVLVGLVAASVFAVAALQSSAIVQDPATTDSKQQDDADKKPTKKRGGLRVPARPLPKVRREPGDDPLKNAVNGAAAGAAAAPVAPPQPAKAKANANPNPNAPRVPTWPFHYTLKLGGADGTALASEYYPARDSFEAPVVVLVHESSSGRASKDFAQPIEDLKGKTFAHHLQEQGFAVFVLNPRGGGENREAQSAAQTWRLKVADMQNVYRFLVDRHNRGELNIAKLGIVALGDAGNVAAAWAASPGGGVSNEGRLSDIGALVFVSPVAEIPGFPLSRTLPSITTRFPLLALSGDRDQASIQAVRDNQRVIERHRQSRAGYYDTSLHAGKLLTFFPKIATSIERFLDDPVKNRKIDWEPRFLLEPAAYGDIQLVADSGFAAAPLPGAAAKKAAQKQANAPAGEAAKKKPAAEEN